MALILQGYTAGAEENRHGRSRIFIADSMGAAGQHRIKWHEAPDEITEDEDAARDRLDAFRRSIDLQRRMVGNPHWAPIVADGAVDGGEAYVSTYYGQSAEQLISQQHSVSDPAKVHQLLSACVDGLLAFQSTCGRAHGNLKPDNILIGAIRPKGGFDNSIVLTDPAPDIGRDAELEDIRNLGALLYFLVMRRPAGVHVSPRDWQASNWEAFGGDADGWASLCRGMLESPWSLQTLQGELVKLKPKGSKLGLVIAAGVVALLAAIIVIKWLPTPVPVPVDTVLAVDKAYRNWFAAWVRAESKDAQASDVRKLLDKVKLKPGDAEFLSKLRGEPSLDPPPDWIQDEVERLIRIGEVVVATRTAILAFSQDRQDRLQEMEDACLARGWGGAVAEFATPKHRMQRMTFVALDGKTPAGTKKLELKRRAESVIPFDSKSTHDLSYNIEKNAAVIADYEIAVAAWAKLMAVLEPARATKDAFLSAYQPGSKRFADFALADLPGEISGEASEGDTAKLAAFVAAQWKNVHAQQMQADPIYQQESVSASAWLRVAGNYLSWPGVGKDLDVLDKQLSDLSKQVTDLSKLPQCTGDQTEAYAKSAATLVAASVALRQVPLVKKNQDDVEKKLANLEDQVSKLATGISSRRLECVEDAGEWVDSIRDIADRWSLFLNDEWHDFKKGALTQQLEAEISRDPLLLGKEKGRIQGFLDFLDALHAAVPYTCDGGGPRAWRKAASEELEEQRDELFRIKIDWGKPAALSMAALEKDRGWRTTVKEFADDRDELCRFLDSFAAIYHGLEQGYAYSEPMGNSSIQALFEPWLKSSRLRMRLPRGVDRLLSPLVERALDLRDSQDHDVGTLLGMLKDDLPPEMQLAAVHRLVLAHQFPLGVADSRRAISTFQQALTRARDGIDNAARRSAITTRGRKYFAIVGARAFYDIYRKEAVEIERSSRGLEADCGALRTQAMALPKTATEQIAAFEKAVMDSKLSAYAPDAEIGASPFNQASLDSLRTLREQLKACGDPCRKIKGIEDASAITTANPQIGAMWTAWIKGLNVNCDPQQRDTCLQLAARLEEVKGQLLEIGTAPKWAIPTDIPDQLAGELAQARQGHIKEALDLLKQDEQAACEQVADNVAGAFEREVAELQRTRQRMQTVLRKMAKVQDSIAVAKPLEEIATGFEAIDTELTGHLKDMHITLAKAVQSLKNIGTVNWATASPALSFAAWRNQRQASPRNAATLKLERDTILPALRKHIDAINDMDTAQAAALRDLLPDMPARWKQTVRTSPAEIAALLAMREGFGVSPDVAVAAWEAVAARPEGNDLLLDHAKFAIPLPAVQRVIEAAPQARLATLVAHAKSSPDILQVALRTLLGKYKLPASRADADALRAALPRAGNGDGFRAIIDGRLQNAEYLRLTQEIAAMSQDVNCDECEGANCSPPKVPAVEATVANFEQSALAHLAGQEAIPTSPLADKLDQLRLWHEAFEKCSDPCKRIERLADGANLPPELAALWSPWVAQLTGPCEASNDPKVCMQLMDQLAAIKASLQATGWAVPDGVAEFATLREQTLRSVIQSQDLSQAQACALADGIAAKFATAGTALQKELTAEQKVATDLQKLEEAFELARSKSSITGALTNLGNSKLPKLQARKAALQQRADVLNALGQIADFAQLRQAVPWANGPNATVFYAWQRLSTEAPETVAALQQEQQVILPELAKRIAAIKAQNADQGRDLESVVPTVAQRWQKASGGGNAGAFLKQHAEFAIPQPAVKAAWQKVVSAGPADMMALLAAHNSYFVSREELADWMTFNLDLQAFRAKIPEDDDALRAATSPFLAKLNGHGRSEVTTLAAGIQQVLAEEAGGGGGAGGDLNSVGPGQQGWRATPSADGSFVRYISPDGSLKLGYRMVEAPGAGKPTFIMTTELPVGAFLQVAKRQATVVGAMSSLPDERIGPRSWHLRGGKPTLSDMWLLNARGYAKWNPADAGKPTLDTPLQYVSPLVADAVARALGCRLPTVAEWQAAYALRGGDTGNLRDAQWAARAALSDDANQSAPPWPDSDAFCGTVCLDIDIESDAVPVTDADDGVLWLRPTQSGSDGFRDLVGNVAEFVVTGTPEAPIRNEDARLRVIGGSALAAAAIWQGQWSSAKEADWFDAGDWWCPDVGLRLAFDAPQASLYSKIKRLLEAQAFLTASGKLAP